MSMKNGNENFEIGQNVFKDTFGIGKSSSSLSGKAYIKDTYPAMSDLLFMPGVKYVLNKKDGEVIKYSEFKKKTLDSIKEELDFQKQCTATRNKLIEENKWNEITDEWINGSIEASEARVLDYEKKLARLKITVGEGKSYDIVRIKQIPITNFLQFDRNNSCKCIYHLEKTPSMKYYPKTNKVHCFGECGKSFDVIDIFQKLNSCDFKTALYQLAKTING